MIFLAASILERQTQIRETQARKIKGERTLNCKPLFYWISWEHEQRARKGGGQQAHESNA